MAVGGSLRAAASLACENIRVSSLFTAGDVLRGEERGEMDVLASSADAGYGGGDVEDDDDDDDDDQFYVSLLICSSTILTGIHFKSS